MAERRPRHRETAESRILREHDETTRKASRSSSRGERTLLKSAGTSRSARELIANHAEAEDRITGAAQAGLKSYQRTVEEEERIRAEEAAHQEAIEERKRSISAKRRQIWEDPDGLHDKPW